MRELRPPVLVDEAADHRERLTARVAMRLVDGDVGAELGFGVGDKRRIDLFVELARNVIGDVEQGSLLRESGDREKEAEGQQETEPRQRILNAYETAR